MSQPDPQTAKAATDTAGVSAHTGKLTEIGGFALIEKIGHGGMGSVFKARQKSLDRIVALKVLPPSIAKNAAFIERFQREARASAKFNHPHIVQGIDVGKDPATGLWYFAMEYVDGPTLKKVLADEKVLPEKRALALVREVAQALESVAAHDIVHRDIKPDNILLTKRGQTKLADLGLAKHTHDDASLTQSGQALGTPYYMAPEQVRGQVNDLDARTDIYALGGTLFHLVTGQPPYNGDTSAVIMSLHLTEPPPKARQLNAQVSESCSRLIEWMMQKEKGERIQSPADLVRQIDKVIMGELVMPPFVTARREAIGENARPTDAPRSRAGLVVGLAAAAAVVVGVAIVVARQGGPSGPVAENKAVADAPKAGFQPPPAKPPGSLPQAKPAAKAPVVAASPAKKNGAQELFHAAQEWEREHPDAYDETLARYQKAAQAAKSAPADAQLDDQIEDAVTAVEARRTQAADKVWQALEEKTAAATAAGDYDGALAACESVPAPLTKMLREKAAAKAKALHQDAEAKISAAVAKIEAYSADAEPAEGQKTLSEIERIAYAPTKGAIAALKTRLQDELANVGELRKKKDMRIATKRLGDLLLRFDKAVLESGDHQAARDVAAEAGRDAALAPVAAQARAMGDVMAGFTELAAMSRDSLAKLKGQKVELETKSGKFPGTVDSIQDGTIKLKMGSAGVEASKAYKVADLTSEEQRRLFSGVVAPRTDAQRTAMALGLLAKGKDDTKAAGELLVAAAAGDFPLAPHYRELLSKREAAAAKALAESKAAAAWAEIDFRGSSGKLGEVEAKVLLAKLQRFETEYAKTEFFATVREQAGTIRERAEKAAATNAVRNGSFETGTAESWDFPTAKENGQCEVVERDAHDGKHAALLSVRARLSMQQSVSVEPGATYRFSIWVKLVSGEGARGPSRIMYADGGGRMTMLVVDFVESLRLKEWKLLEGVIQLQPTAARGTLIIFVRSQGPLELLLDEVRLVRQTTAAKPK